MKDVIESINKYKAPIIVIDGELDKYKQNNKFDKKLAQANSFIAKVGIPTEVFHSKPIQQILFYKEKPIRRVEKDGQWYYNIVDIIEALTGSTLPKKYWEQLSKHLYHIEGKKIWEKRAFISNNDKVYPMDAATLSNILLIISTTPSSNGFQSWLLENEPSL